MALSPRVMGIVNVTPDSFFPDSRTPTVAAAIERGRWLRQAGADVIDVGGESTRPGATLVSADEEIARVVPVVAGLAGEVVVSVDTSKPEVARATVAAGATIINDVTGELVELAGQIGVGIVAMHSRGLPATTPEASTSPDIVGEVVAFLEERARRARAAGVPRLWLDPGIGFSKTADENWALLGHLGDIVSLARGYGADVLVGTSRKRFLDTLAHTASVAERLEGSLATATWAMACGVDLVRVHDVAATAQARDLLVGRRSEEVA